ncbi:MAG: methyltransferase domain-containing protein [Magnetococcales bacterium]|nr:methyltransferase domain-containing protein [Magnetococcales bacterium]MBF0322381.1 methyltransferase domain-containing protein [Magnetococcales bacterium]
MPADAERYDLDAVFTSPKYSRTQRPFDFLNRYQMIIRRVHPDWDPLDFSGKRVLELGCGPNLGWGPLAVFLGCSAYVSTEPMFHAGVWDHPLFERPYLLGCFRDFTGLFGPRMAFAEFCRQVRERITVTTDTRLQEKLGGRFDIMLSNSVLEHITPLQESVVALRDWTAPGGRFLHCVDFGSHRPLPHPLQGLFTMEPERYFQKHGRHVNLFRASDILEFFRQAGFDCQLTPYYSAREYYPDTIHPYWRDRYDPEILFLKVGIFHGGI